jgi:hypothetical protein
LCFTDCKLHGSECGIRTICLEPRQKRRNVRVPLGCRKLSNRAKSSRSLKLRLWPHCFTWAACARARSGPKTDPAKCVPTFDWHGVCSCAHVRAPVRACVRAPVRARACAPACARARACPSRWSGPPGEVVRVRYPHCQSPEAKRLCPEVAVGSQGRGHAGDPPVVAGGPPVIKGGPITGA